MRDGVHRFIQRFGVSTASGSPGPDGALDPLPTGGDEGSDAGREHRGAARQDTSTACPCAERRSSAASPVPLIAPLVTTLPRKWATPVRKAGGSPYFFGLGVSLTALAPKCPMCLAAYLSLFGVGGAAASVVHPLLRPLGALLVTLAVGNLVRHWLVARRRTSRHGVEAPHSPPTRRRPVTS